MASWSWIVRCAVTMLLIIPSMWSECDSCQEIEEPVIYWVYSIWNQCRGQGSPVTEASLSVDETGQFLTFTFSGNGFLYKQIRNMSGTLLKIEITECQLSRLDLIWRRRTENLQVQRLHRMACI